MTTTPYARIGIALAIAALSACAVAKATPQEIERLGKDATPLGAEKAGNKDGTIPAWDGGLTKAPAGFDVSKGYADPYAADEPPYTITAANAEQYKDKLSPGQMAMLKKHAAFKIVVYPTHRSAALPPAEYEAIRKHAAEAELAVGGNGVKDSGASPTPFPFPKSAEEILWNHNLRWRGGSVESDSSWYVVQPSGSHYRIALTEKWAFEAQGFLDARRDNVDFDIMAYYRAPANLEGTIYLAWDPLDQTKETRSGWVYNAGQRRVRRVPELCCDYVADGTDGLRYTDQYDGWNGETDRYTWKLLGRKEMIVPYNVYKLTDKSLKADDVLKPGNVNPDLVRNELHRVWVVEGELKKGARHVFAKRTMYFDEDTYQIVAADLYDSRGELWRYQETYPIQYYDATVPYYSGMSFYDLNSGAYMLSWATFEEKGIIKFGQKQRLADYQPDALRRMGGK